MRKIKVDLPDALADELASRAASEHTTVGDLLRRGADVVMGAPDPNPEAGFDAPMRTHAEIASDAGLRAMYGDLFPVK